MNSNDSFYELKEEQAVKITMNSFRLELSFFYSRENKWFAIPDEAVTEKGFVYETGDARYYCSFICNKPGIVEYRMGFRSGYPTQLRFSVRVENEEGYYHLIPCNIYGDNNAAGAKPGEFPLLTTKYPENPFCSERWEFRADRASTPVSVLACNKGAVGLSIDPYSDAEGGIYRETESAKHIGEFETGKTSGQDAGQTCRYIHNGVFAELPDKFGVTLGYTNYPVTFINKRTPGHVTMEMANAAEAAGTLYIMPGKGRLEVHPIIREEYMKRHKRAEYRKTLIEAAKGLVDSLVNVNWNDEDKQYTNRSCKVPGNTELKPWRNVVEIGWTGGAVLAYPLVLGRFIPGVAGQDTFARALPGEGLIDRIVGAYNEKSGLFNNLTVPARPGSESLLNGWWTGYGLVRDCHCAYTVGSAAHYVLKTISFLQKTGRDYPENWLATCRKVVDTAIDLQREDGAFGYTYDAEERRVLDWDGFAGCWFAPAAAYLYHLTGDKKYIDSAKKALRYYHNFVEKLNCYGAPMDTWKSVDQEGNLAFIRGCRLVHEYTGEEEFLRYLVEGTGYEYLWRYAYPTRPVYRPLNDGWNACGGSVTSVSNPHIHPMGVIIDSDLRYLAKVTGDHYHRMRADDSTAWLMQTLELYPDKTGYGRYGVLSERWCPSDGLTTERYSDGTPCSTWFSYNLWAAANALEAVCEYLLESGE